ncbi:SWIM zinc finger domain-containing protein [Gordonia humi]|uniref:SWIM zinc finger family protein n=1 Tax=Gordonia humi TaxID=686429 RepID=UPI003622028F
MPRTSWTPQQTTQILTFFDKGSLSRGRGYAQSGLVHSISWSGDTVTGLSEGSAGQTYTCSVTARFDGARAQVRAQCTCPVQTFCKHCVALVVTASDSAPGPAAQAPPPPASALELSRWRSLVDEITADKTATPTTDDGPELPLGLQFALDLDARGRRRIVARPVTHGSRGTWVTTRVTWKSLLTTRKAGFRHDPKARELLVEIGNALAARTQRSTPPAELSLSSAPARVWPLLNRAEGAGIALIGKNGWGQPQTVSISSITTGLHVERAQRHLNIGIQTFVDGDPVGADRVLLLGAPKPHGAGVLLDRTLHLGPLPELTASETMLLTSRSHVSVPANEVDEFRARLPALVADRAVSFGDDVFPPEDVDGPYPVLVVDYTADGARTRWEAEYVADGESVRARHDEPANPHRVRRRADENTMWSALGSELAAVASTYRGWFDTTAERLLRGIYQSSAQDEIATLVSMRERLAETTTVAAALEFLPISQFLRDWSLDPVEAAVLTGDVLPALVDGGRVRVEVVGEPPDYHRPEEPPVLHFTGDSSTDWFDLAITLDVDGHRIPIADVIAALAQGETHMLLADDTYFPLDTPELTTLRERLAEARELGDLDGDRVSSSTMNVTLWEELLELGVVDEQLADWRDRLTRLASAKPPAPIAPPRAWTRGCAATSRTDSTGSRSSGTTDSAASSPTTWGWARPFRLWR